MKIKDKFDEIIQHTAEDWSYLTKSFVRTVV
mgnify:CR=1 FL=1